MFQYDISDRIPELLSFVYISCINYFFDSLCEIVSFSERFHREQHKKFGNKLIVFEIAKTNNEMMSSVLFQHFRVAWGKFIQTGTLDSHARFETRFCHTGSTNTYSLWLVDTFDKSQTSIQHNHLCDLMNVKENILFLRNV